jgi:hypothetical protein
MHHLIEKEVLLGTYYFIMHLRSKEHKALQLNSVDFRHS